MMRDALGDTAGGLMVDLRQVLQELRLGEAVRVPGEKVIDAALFNLIREAEENEKNPPPE